MICYRDMTFCSHPCANTACSRNLNDDVRERARAWWGSYGDPPIDISDMRTDGCGFVELDKEKVNGKP